MTVDTAAVRARAERATPGPWRTWNDGHVGSPTVHIGGGVMPTPGSDPAQRMPDAEFIAAARTDVPALCDALDEARAEIAVLSESLAAANADAVAEYRRAEAAEAALAERDRQVAERIARAIEQNWSGWDGLVRLDAILQVVRDQGDN